MVWPEQATAQIDMPVYESPETASEKHMEIEIRPAATQDTCDISQMIIAALRATNAKDYSPAIIAQIEQSFAPSAVAALINQRTVFVASIDGHIVGTASLDGHVVRTVFVRPDMHGQGVGRSLMDTIVRVAQDQSIETLLVPSSVTAERFYKKLGFSAVRENFHGEERTIVMERRLPISMTPWSN